MTKIKLELISNSDMYLYLMDCIRGGIGQVNKKFVKADNIYTRKVQDESSNKKVTITIILILKFIIQKIKKIMLNYIKL